MPETKLDNAAAPNGVDNFPLTALEVASCLMLSSEAFIWFCALVVGTLAMKKMIINKLRFIVFNLK